MGLLIKKYKYGYGMLHDLRQAALKVDNIDKKIEDFYYCDINEITTKFQQFVVHSDCDGVYVSKSSKQYDKLYKKWKKLCDNNDEFRCFFGDLDELKKEVQELNISIHKYLNGYTCEAWKEFYNDVMSSRKILEFC